MVRVVHCHAGVLDSNPGGPKYFPLGITSLSLIKNPMLFNTISGDITKTGTASTLHTQSEQRNKVLLQIIPLHAAKFVFTIINKSDKTNSLPLYSCCTSIFCIFCQKFKAEISYRTIIQTPQQLCVVQSK